MMNERIYTIMTKDVLTVNPTDSLGRIRDLLFNKGFHHFPVVEGKKLVGIVTSWDIMKRNLKWEETEAMQVQDVMTSQVATLYPEDHVGAAAQVFLKHLFHGLPIVNNDYELVGIVTTHDVLKYEFLKAYPDDYFIKETRWLKTANV